MAINHLQTANLLGLSLTEWLQIKKENPNCIVYLESGDIDVNLTLQNISKNTTSKKLDTNTEHTDIYHEISILKNSIDVIANIINTSFFEAMRKQNMQVSSLNSHLQEIAHKVENLELSKLSSNPQKVLINNNISDDQYLISKEETPEQNLDENLDKNSAALQENIEEINLEIHSNESHKFTPDNPPEPFFIGRIETKKKLFGIFPL